MGQYYKAVNLDKKEFLSPHACGDGAKLMEFALSTMGMISCLAILLADGNGRGGGDLFGDKCKACDGKGWPEGLGEPRCTTCDGVRRELPEIVGSWAGDRIVISGDDSDAKKFVSECLAPEEWNEDLNGKPNLYSIVCEEYGWKDISTETMCALAKDKYVRDELRKRDSYLWKAIADHRKILGDSK